MHQNLEQMKINKNNYEAFFLLYADNELNAEERTMVEKFVEEHRDLQEELFLFIQTKLPAEDTVIYPHKAGLLKHFEVNPVNEGNYNEYFLLYIDDELKAEERKAVEQFVVNHKEKQAELTLLQRVKIVPEENVVFNNKDILYRAEKKPVRIMPMRWISIAAAASVLLTGIAVWTNVNDNETTATFRHSILAGKGAVKEVKQTQQQIKQHTEDLNDVIAEEKNGITKADEIEETRSSTSNPPTPKQTKAIEPAINNIQQKTGDEERSSTQRIAAMPTNEHKTEPVNNVTIPDTPMALNNIAKPVRNVKPLILDQQAFNGEDKNQSQNEVENNEHVVLLDADNNEKKPKGKLRGLLRKASRFVDHITNTGNGDDQSVVRVASFEIAKK